MKKNLLLLFLVFAIYANVNGSVNLILPDVHGQTGSQITVPVKVKYFQDIVSCQGTIQFDPAIVTYASVQQFGLSGMNSSSFGVTGVSSGVLTFSWFDGTLAGVTLADSAIIFSITFNIIGTNAQVSQLTFSNSPTLIEVVDIAFNPLTTVLDNGSITVQNGTTINDVTLYIDSTSNTVGSQVSVSMKAVGFTNINSVQGTLQFDPAVATYSSVSYFGLPGMNASNFGVSQISSGKLTFTWYDSSLEGVNVADDLPLFTVVFTLTCTPANSSLVNIISTPTLIEVTDSLFNTLNTTVISGTVTSQELVVTPNASPSLICLSQPSTLSATGANSYTWMPGSLTGQSVVVNPTSTTTYTVTGTSNGCTDQEIITVTVEQNPVADFTYVDNGNGSVTFTNTSQNATTYIWDFGDGSIDYSVNPSHTYTTSDTYAVVLSASNSCGADFQTISIDIITGISKSSVNTPFSIYPNPGNGNFNLKYSNISGSNIMVNVSNSSGKNVFSKEFKNNNSSEIIPLDLTILPNGIYQVEIINSNQTSRASIVVNK